jgi:hypothetical protein
MPVNDLETVLEIVKQVNVALSTLKDMGVKFEGILNIPILLKAFKILP